MQLIHTLGTYPFLSFGTPKILPILFSSPQNVTEKRQLFGERIYNK